MADQVVELIMWLGGMFILIAIVITAVARFFRSSTQSDDE